MVSGQISSHIGHSNEINPTPHHSLMLLVPKYIFFIAVIINCHYIIYINVLIGAFFLLLLGCRMHEDSLSLYRVDAP